MLDLAPARLYVSQIPGDAGAGIERQYLTDPERFRAAWRGFGPSQRRDVALAFCSHLFHTTGRALDWVGVMEVWDEKDD